jgi:hypothetical protein
VDWRSVLSLENAVIFQLIKCNIHDININVILDRCFITGCVTGLIFGLIGSMCKEGAIAGVGPTWTLNKNSRVAGPLSHEYDFTLKKNYPGYWVRTPEEIPAAMERGQLGGPY